MLKSYTIKKVIVYFVSLLLISSICINISKNKSVVKAADSVSHVIINQVFGGGKASDGAISHGFIELYNPTDNDIDLSTNSIQYSKGKENNIATDGPFDWNVLNLTGKMIKAHQSFLIRCDSGVVVNATDTPRYTISNWDMNWSQEISNRSFHVALVSNQSKLSPILTANESKNVIDLIGAKNTGAGDVVYHSEGASLDGISKQKSARRINFQDTDKNSEDFKIIDYRVSGMNDDELARVKPRYSGDGVWGTDIGQGVDDEDKKLAFSHKAGLYASPFALSMNTDYASGVIRYTTDGSDPVANSREYTAPISIQDRTNDTNVLAEIMDITTPGKVLGGYYSPPSSKIFKGNIIKAKVFSVDGNALTDTYTNSYFVNAKYDNLPVISLVTDKANFFDANTGIYVNGNYFNKGSEWERPIHFEMFEPNGTIAVSQNMGVRNNGGVSRNLPQKSLRLYAKKGYDEQNPTVEYDLFQGRAKKGDGSVLTSFKRLLLRNSGNDNSYSLIRDAMMQSLIHDTNTMIQSYRQSVVFLNGEFWGIYNIRERIDDESVLRKYDIDDIEKIGILEFVHNEENLNIPDEYDETIPEMKDDYDAYMEMWNWFKTTTSINSTENYLKAQTFIDMDSFIDYYIINVFVNNNDWPGNNNQMWRYRTPYPTESTISNNNYKDGRWRWMLKDTDSGFSLYTGSAETNSLARLAETTNTDYSNATWSTLFFRRLITNQEFKDKFVNRFCDLLNTNFKKDVVNAKIDEMVKNISGTIDRHIDRWPDGINGKYGWERTISNMKTFADGRVSNMRSHLKSFFSIAENTTTLTLNSNKERGYLTINGIPITSDTDGVTDPSSWSGTYFINKTQTISAIPYEGYRFDKFIIDSKEYKDDTITVTPTKATTIQAVFINPSMENPGEITGKIIINEGFWTSFLELVTFQTYHKEEQVVTIEANADNEIAKVEYCISEQDVPLDHVGSLAFIEYKDENKPVLQKGTNNIVYVKISDVTGGYIYIRSDGVVIESDKEPVASPTIQPTASPTIQPTANPTMQPTTNPKIQPTTNPKKTPTTPIIIKKQLPKPTKLKLTAKKATWKNVANNNGYKLKIMNGKKVVKIVQIKKGKTSYKINKKLFKKGKKYKFTLVAKGKGKYQNSKVTTSKILKVKK